MISLIKSVRTLLRFNLIVRPTPILACLTISLFFLLQYVIPVLLGPFLPNGSSIAVNYNRLSLESIIKSWGLIGVFFLTTVVFYKYTRHSTENLESRIDERLFFLTGALAIYVGCAVKIYRLLTNTHHQWVYLPPTDPFFDLQYFFSLNTFFYIGLAFLLLPILAQSKRENVTVYKIVWSIFGLIIVISLFNLNGKLYLFLGVFTYIFTKACTSGISLARLIIISTLTVTILFPVKNLSRELGHINAYYSYEIIKDLPMGQQGSRNMLTVIYNSIYSDGMHLWNPTVDTTALGEMTNVKSVVNMAVKYATDTTFGRLNASHIFAILHEKTMVLGFGSPCQYLQGRMVAMLIADWPYIKNCKLDPVYSKWNIESGLSDGNTGIGLGVVGEFYYLHGFNGAALMMFLFACAIFVAYSFLSRTGVVFVPILCITLQLIANNMETSIISLVDRLSYELLLIGILLTTTKITLALWDLTRKLPINR